MQPPRIRFRPVELKARHDGWTPARQVYFIEVLATTRSIAAACSAVEMSRASAYKLRDRPDARQFRLAWHAALRPEFDRSRRVSPRTAARRVRLTRLNRGKVDELKEMEGPPVSAHDGQATSSALATLQTYLARLREQERSLGSPAKG